MNDEPSIFYWNYKINIDDRNNLWVADANRQIVYYISKEEETWNAIFRVSGTENLLGSRDGSIQAATFDGPESLTVFTTNATKTEMARNLKPVWLANYTDEACINAN